MAKKRKIEQVENGHVIRVFDSLKEAADSLGLQKSSICEVLKQRRYKSTGGYVFRYSVDELEGEVWRMHQLGRLVSNFGRVEDLHGLRSYGVTTRLGYKRVQIGDRKYFVHRLVLEAFLCPRPPHKECDHIDRNRSNNRIENLRWVTHLENVQNK
jgi:hypothetical protein